MSGSFWCYGVIEVIFFFFLAACMMTTGCSLCRRMVLPVHLLLMGGIIITLQG